jgi:hypothetical protein
MQNVKKGLISGKHEWWNDLCDVVAQDWRKLNTAIVTVLCRVDDGRWNSRGYSRQGYNLKGDQRQAKLAKRIHLVHEDSVIEITEPCIHTCDGLFICQLYLLPDLLEETDCKEDMPLTLPFASFVPLSQLIIVLWIKTSVGTTTVFHMGISRAVAAA